MTLERALPAPEAFRYKTPVQVRFRDLDGMGHVNNAVYFSYFEVARTGYMRTVAQLEPDVSPFELFPFIVAEITCRFLEPVGVGQGLIVHARVPRLGGKSFDFEYLATDEATGRPVAVGRSVQVCYDYATGATQAIPAGLRDRIEGYEGGVR